MHDQCSKKDENRVTHIAFFYDKEHLPVIYRKFVKRLLDILLSLIALPFFGILCLVLVPAILLQDGRPVFYISPRLGKNGKVFQMFKFRSMLNNAPDIRLEDGSTYNAEDDPRVTPLGRLLRKTSLDEIPQILNVLRGDMSFVGPRPDLPGQRELYEQEDIKKLDVLPGITGYSQAFFRNSIEWKERLKLDVYYAEHVSFILDIKIMYQTFATVLTRKNIYVKPQQNAEQPEQNQNAGKGYK